METRFLNARQLELRTVANGDMVLGGYAARYNHASKPIASRNGGSFQEVLMPSAFRDVLSDPNLDTVALINHDANKVLGRTLSKTLRLSSDHLGLQFEVDLSPKISHHRDVYEQVKRGDLQGCSFAFQVGEDEWSDGTAYPTRTIHSVKTLRDVSVVTDPAYEHTEVGIRSEVDLCEVRSRFGIAIDLRPAWWFPVCERLGMDPDKTTKRDLMHAWKQAGSPEIRMPGTEVVLARRRQITDLLLG